MSILTILGRLDHAVVGISFKVTQRKKRSGVETTSEEALRSN